MFRHAKNLPEDIAKKPDQAVDVVLVSGDSAAVKSKVPDEPATEASLKELIEKNLKWSQIIYEQNRKINSKLLWTAIAGWIRVFLILIPLLLAVFLLPALLKNVWSQYRDLLSGSPNSNGKASSVESMLKLFNVDPAKQEQIKALLK